MAIANITGNILTDSGVATSSLLPLTGGTLTGALNGTTATFSGTVSSIVTSGGTSFRVVNSVNSRAWSLVPSTNGAESDLWLYYGGTGTGTKVSFVNNGNVLIGSTTDSGELLQVNGTSKFTGALSGTSATFSTEVTSSGSQGRFGGWATGAGYQGNALEAGVSGGTATLLGYNRTSGAYIPLTIGGNTNQTTTIGGNTIVLQNNGTTALTIASTGAATFSSSVTVPSITNGGSFKMDYASNASSRSWRIISDSYNFGDFSIQQSTTQAGSTYADRLLISASGNVGIGTSSPTQLLEVSSSSLPRIVITNTTNSANSGLYFNTKNSSGTVQSGGIYYIPGTTPYLALSGDNSGTHLNITSGGNVLVATTTDNGQGKLQVNGAITANNISYTGELVTNSTTFNATYYHIISGAASSGQTYTLPSPSSNNLQYVIINKSPFSQTISAGSGFTIYNMAGSDVGSITLASKARCFIIADGSGFYQIF